MQCRRLPLISVCAPLQGGRNGDVAEKAVVVPEYGVEEMPEPSRELVDQRSATFDQIPVSYPGRWHGVERIGVFIRPFARYQPGDGDGIATPCRMATPSNRHQCANMEPGIGLTTGPCHAEGDMAVKELGGAGGHSILNRTFVVLHQPQAARHRIEPVVLSTILLFVFVLSHDSSPPSLSLLAVRRPRSPRSASVRRPSRRVG